MSIIFTELLFDNMIWHEGKKLKKMYLFTWNHS